MIGHSALQGGHIAAIIMASLSRLGGNAHVAKRILRLLSTHLPGRVVLRLGAAKWQAQATGGEFATAVGSKASLQWAASRLWAAGTYSNPALDCFACRLDCGVRAQPVARLNSRAVSYVHKISSCMSTSLFQHPR